MKPQRWIIVDNSERQHNAYCGHTVPECYAYAFWAGWFLKETEFQITSACEKKPSLSCLKFDTHSVVPKPLIGS